MRRVTLNQLIRYAQNRDSWPAWLASLQYCCHVPEPVIAEDDYYGEQRLQVWAKACETLPRCVEACPHLQTFTFTLFDSPDVFVMRLLPQRSPRLFRQATRQVPETYLEPV
jgi:hypothetical protein